MLLSADVSLQRLIGVCHGPRCGDYGGRALAEQFMQAGISFEKLDCQSLCPHAPVVRVDGVVKLKANIAKVLE